MENDGFSLVVFSSTACSACKLLMNDLDRMIQQYDATYAKYMLDQNSMMAKRYNVMSLPTALIFKCGAPVNQMSGYRGVKKIKEFLDDSFGANE